MVGLGRPVVPRIGNVKDESELTEVRPQVWITDRRTGRDRERLAAEGFRAALCLDRAEFDFSADPELSPLIVWLQALDLQGPARELFEGAVESLKTLVDRHGKVVVHCHHGTGRSVAVVAAYLADTEKLSPKAALEEVARLRGGLDDVSRGLRSLVEVRP